MNAYTIAQKWLSKAIATTAILALFAANTITANAFTLIDLTVTPVVHAMEQNVKINSHSASPSTINSSKGETMTINYCLNSAGYVTVGIYKPEGKTGSKIVDIMRDVQYQELGCYNSYWNGKNDYESEIGAVNQQVAEGTYFYGIELVSTKGYEYAHDYIADWVYVDNTNKKVVQEEVKVDTQVAGTSTAQTQQKESASNKSNTSNSVYVELENETFDPWNDQSVEINFTLQSDSAVSLKIYDEDSYLVATVANQKPFKKGTNSLEWDGTNKYAEVLYQGEYTYELTVNDGNEAIKKKGYIYIKKGTKPNSDTVDPRLKYVFATKETFDPGRKESTYIAFTLTAKADVEISIYDKNSYKVVELAKEKDVPKGSYNVKWDGYEVLGTEDIYEYKVSAKNSKGEDTQKGKIEIKEDDKPSKKPNIYKDKLDQIHFSPKNNKLSISFTLERDADITLEIREDGKVIATPVKEVKYSEGLHKILWNGVVEYSQYAENGVYEYKLIADSMKGKDVETGYFAVENVNDAKKEEEKKTQNEVEKESKGNTQNNNQGCGGFTDVGAQYCVAVEWGSSAGVIGGYGDGSFQPNKQISRAEALKMIFETMNINTVEAGTTGFSDVSASNWYSAYVKTAMSLGIVNGYKDGTFRPNNGIIRVEALKMMLQTAQAKYGIAIKSEVYGQPYQDTPNNADTKWYMPYAQFAKDYNLADSSYSLRPNAYMTRGDMANMLYSYQKAGLAN